MITPVTPDESQRRGVLDESPAASAAPMCAAARSAPPARAPLGAAHRFLPPERLPLLVTGITGVAGYNAWHYFRQRYPGRVVGLVPVQNRLLRGEGIVAGALEDRRAVRRLVERHGFGSVLNCAGNCALKPCELDPSLAWRTNVDGLASLVDALAGRSVRLVHLSVDLVYSGSGVGGYVEDDPTDPVTVYGRTMVAAEELLMAADPAACLVRISLPMGISLNGHAGAIDWIQSRFRRGLPATLYYDEVRTPTYTDCLNRLFEELLTRPLAGLYHAGGPRRLSLYQIAQIVNRVGGYDPDCLRGCPRSDAGPLPPRAGNVSLHSRRLAEALGYEPLDPWPHDPRLVPTDQEWHRRRPRGEEGSPQWLAQVLYSNPRRGSESCA